MNRRVTVLTASVLVAACASDVGGPPDPTAALGIVSWDDAPATVVESAELEPGSEWGDGAWGSRPALVVPASVESGVPFTVEATTALPNACWQAGQHDTTLEASVATITVYDQRSNADLCALVFSWATRQIEIQFDEPGPAMIRLVGRRVSGNEIDGGEEIVVEHTLTVH